MSELVPLSILAGTQVITASALGHAFGELHQQRHRLDAQAEAIRVLAQPLHIELPRQDGDGEKKRHLRALALLLLSGPAIWLWTHLRTHPHALIGAAVGAAGTAVIGALLFTPGRSAPPAPVPPPRAAGPTAGTSPSPASPPASASAPSMPATTTAVPVTPAPPPRVVVVIAVPPTSAHSSPPTAVPTPTPTSAPPSAPPPTQAPSPVCVVSLSVLGIVSACL